jgi:LysM repeat protein
MSKRSLWIGLAAILLLGTLTASVALAGATDLPSVVAKTPAATPAPDGDMVHVVKRGETLRAIAQSYRVRLSELITFNRIVDPDRIYVGEVLRIPSSVETTVPRPRLTPVAPAPSPCTCEEIAILDPGRGVTVTNPIAVSGIAASPFEQTVVVRVLDGSGGSIGLASAVIAGEYGQRGPFSVTVPFTVPANSQPGRIQVFTESPRDGALEHLSSVSVMLQGAGLDALLGQLDAAIDARHYATLESLMGPSFRLGLYRSEGVPLKPAEMRERLQLSYLGPGAPRLDFGVDGRSLLGAQVAIGPKIRHVVYSTGWGPGGDDDAFLLIGDVDGRARWVGMVYVPHALIDYPAPRGM